MFYAIKVFLQTCYYSSKSSLLSMLFFHFWIIAIRQCWVLKPFLKPHWYFERISWIKNKDLIMDNLFKHLWKVSKGTDGSIVVFQVPIILLKPFSDNPTKLSSTLEHCFSVFDHFVGLALKGLKTVIISHSFIVDGNWGKVIVLIKLEVGNFVKLSIFSLIILKGI